MPAFNPFREDRLRRMRELLKMIERGKEMDFDFVLGLGGLKWGSTEPSIEAMIRQLEKARMLEVVNHPETEQRTIKYIGSTVEEKEEKTKKKREVVKSENP